MELQGERVGVGEEQVRAEGEVERAVSEAEMGERICAVAATIEASGHVFREATHGGEPYLAQSLGRSDVAPHEPIGMFADAGEEGVGGFFYPVPDSVGGEAVQRVTRDCSVARLGGFGVEARGARGAVEDAASEVP